MQLSTKRKNALKLYIHPLSLGVRCLNNSEICAETLKYNQNFRDPQYLLLWYELLDADIVKILTLHWQQLKRKKR